MIPPRSGDSSSTGDDAGEEDAVAPLRPRRVALRKLSMSQSRLRKRGQPSSSRGNPSNIGVKQSPLKKFRRLRGSVRKSPLAKGSPLVKGCEVQGMSSDF